MGGLIDADALIDKLKELGWIEDTLLDEIINEMPTAYDVEKVIKNLRLTCYAMGLEEYQADVLVKVVRKGGVNE